MNLTFVKVAPEAKCFLSLFKGWKWKEKEKKFVCLPHGQSQICPFWGPKKLLIQTEFQNFILAIVNFIIWSRKNIPVRQHRARFRKSPNSAISLHLCTLYSIVCTFKKSLVNTWALKCVREIPVCVGIYLVGWYILCCTCIAVQYCMYCNSFLKEN